MMHSHVALLEWLQVSMRTLSNANTEELTSVDLLCTMPSIGRRARCSFPWTFSIRCTRVQRLFW